MTVKLSSIVSQGSDPVCAKVGGELVMMSIEKGNYYSLDETGNRIWQLIAQPISVAALCEKLLADFSVDRDTCEADVLKFLNKLERQNLIQLRP